MTREPDEGNGTVASPCRSTNSDTPVTVPPDSTTNAERESTTGAVPEYKGFIYDAVPEESRCYVMDATNATSRDCEHVPIESIFESIEEAFDEMALSDSSKQRYLYAILAAVKQMDGIDPAAWTEEMLREWSKKARKRAPSSVGIEFSAMKNYLMVKGRNDLLGIQWVWKLSGLGQGKRMRDVDKKMIPLKDLDILLGCWNEEMDNPRITWTRIKRLAVCLTFADTGMRATGAEHLRVKDMDFERNRVHIHKTKKAKARTVPVDLKYMVAMRRYVSAREERIKEKGLPKELLEPTAPLFFQELRNIGTPLKSHILSEIIGDESKKVLGKAHTAHAYRHAKATRLLKEGFSEKQVQDYMGHVNFSTTSIYVHLSAEDLDRAYRARNGNGEKIMDTKDEDGPNDAVSVAVDMLTKQFIAGSLDPDRYAAAVKALKK